MSIYAFQIRISSLIPASGMALFPFILLKKKEYRNDDVLINHERIHLRQQLETGIFPFYLCYLIMYLGNRMKGFNHNNAYKEILFEREAFAKQSDPDYLNNRAFWAFLNY